MCHVSGTVGLVHGSWNRRNICAKHRAQTHACEAESQTSVSQYIPISQRQTLLELMHSARAWHAPWQMARKVSHSRMYSARDTLENERPSQSATISIPNTHSRLP